MLVTCGSSADPLPTHAATVVEYDIEVSLDAVRHRLLGHERLVWHNPAQAPVRELWFHLYLNAFRNNASTFFRESGGRLRVNSADDDGWGSIDVTSLRQEGGTDLLPGARFEHPDDNNGDDRTVLRVPLPEPVPAGGKLALQIDFEAQLPRVFARTGYAGDFHCVGQWFPKLAVFEPAGRRGRVQAGWNAHQFHANSEFYADYGRYRVAINVPARFVVGATGQRVELREHADGTRTHVYEQADVHDFAWAADPSFEEFQGRFEARSVSATRRDAKARELGRTPAELALRDVEIRLLMQPGRRGLVERHLAALRQALERFGLDYGAYPYPTLTLVDPPPNGLGAGGMEYPTFITGMSSVLFQRWPLDRVRIPEQVAVHEFAHQYWYGLVGSNEFEEAWLDEGLATYSTSALVDDWLGPETSLAELLGLRIGDGDLPRAANSHERRFDTMRTPAWGFSSSSQYSFNSYARPSLMLQTLRGLVGPQTLARILRTYHERWRFRHPGSDDFYDVASEVAQRDLRPFFHATVESPGVLDHAVTLVRSRPVAKRAGIDAPGGETAGAFESRVDLRRLGELQLSVDVELEFEGRAPERRPWAAGERFARWDFERPERLVAVRLDPDRLLALDASRLNDARRVRPDGRAAAHWATRMTFWVQQLLAALAL